MTNENIPEPIFPSGFSVEEIKIPIESDKLTSEMVDLIKNRDKCSLEVHDKNIEFRKKYLEHTEKTKRFGMALAFSLFVSILIYSVVSGDKALTEKVVIGSISAVAGAGGVLINQPKDK